MWQKTWKTLVLGVSVDIYALISMAWSSDIKYLIIISTGNDKEMLFSPETPLSFLVSLGIEISAASPNRASVHIS